MTVAASTLSEVVELAATDTELFGKTFFPGSFRSPSPGFHQEIFQAIEGSGIRHSGLMVFRGGAKTTILRVYTAKRIGYGLSRTILYVGATQEHAKKSVRWLRRQMERNRAWVSAFGLERGKIWTDEVLELWHKPFGFPITVIAVGITGQVRGINVDDYRPDLIIVDDPDSEESAGTPMRRKKTAEVFFGALEKSLAPASENPEARMVLLQTPIARDDLINTCAMDPSWAVASFGCFDEQGESRWPTRFPTETLRREKQEYANRNQLSIWLREMECVIVGEETAFFREEWLRSYATAPELGEMAVVVAIDPVPPPSERETQAGLAQKDFEVLSVVGRVGVDIYLLEYVMRRGHTPDWTIAEFFRLVEKWHPLKVVVESVAYQRTLSWLLGKEMSRRGLFVQVKELTSPQKKQIRIVQSFSGISAHGHLWVNKTDHTEFISQWITYPYVSHDDVLDSVSLAVHEVLDMDVGYDLGEPGAIAGLLGPGEAEADWRAAP